jgi:formylglycine-generating enzyme required for sulfatase activity
MTRSGSAESAMILLFAVGALLLLPHCSQDASTVVEPSDTTPPSVTTLRMDTVTPSSVAFSWRAPGDDLLFGTAGRYELRYATFPLDPQNFTQGTAAAGLPKPGEARSAQDFTVTGLTPGQTYFFGLRASDEASNWSPVSAIINVTLPEQEDGPVLWGALSLPSTGTQLSAFLYQVRVRRVGGQPPAEAPLVEIGGVAHPMRLLADDGVSVQYQTSLKLPAGEHDFRFVYTDQAGQTAYLPNPGTWSGPTVDSVETVPLEFVTVPPDTFGMGSPQLSLPWDERPAHTAVLTRAFEMDRREITNAQYCAALNWGLEQGRVGVIGDTLVVSLASMKPLLVTASLERERGHGIRYARETGFTPLPSRENWPVTHATWYGAAFFCNVRCAQDGLALSYDEAHGWICGPGGVPYAAEDWRLPTEAEWECTARGRDDRTYPTGDTPPVAGVTANFGPLSHAPSPVGSYPEGVNPFGLLDLAGNVWEWCNDWYYQYELVTAPGGSEIPQVDPRGPQAAVVSRVARGGSWGSALADLRCARRLGVRPEASLGGLGFRCVRSVAGQ